MSKASLSAIVDYCGRLLRVSELQDYEGAVNGLQVENDGKVTRVAATVDALKVWRHAGLLPDSV